MVNEVDAADVAGFRQAPGKGEILSAVAGVAAGLVVGEDYAGSVAEKRVLENRPEVADAAATQ